MKDLWKAFSIGAIWYFVVQIAPRFNGHDLLAVIVMTLIASIAVAVV